MTTDVTVIKLFSSSLMQHHYKLKVSNFLVFLGYSKVLDYFMILHLIGMLLGLPLKVSLTWKMFLMKHSGLFCWSICDKEKGFSNYARCQRYIANALSTAKVSLKCLITKCGFHRSICNLQVGWVTYVSLEVGESETRRMCFYSLK